MFCECLNSYGFSSVLVIVKNSDMDKFNVLNFVSNLSISRGFLENPLLLADPDLKDHGYEKIGNGFKA